MTDLCSLHFVCVWTLVTLFVTYYLHFIWQSSLCRVFLTGFGFNGIHIRVLKRAYEQELKTQVPSHRNYLNSTMQYDNTIQCKNEQSVCVYMMPWQLFLFFLWKSSRKKKKKGLEVCFLCLNCEDDQEFVHLFPIVRFFFGMAPDLFCFSEKWCDQTQKLSSINKLYIRKKNFINKFVLFDTHFTLHALAP